MLKTWFANCSNIAQSNIISPKTTMRDWEQTKFAQINARLREVRKTTLLTVFNIYLACKANRLYFRKSKHIYKREDRSVHLES